MRHMGRMERDDRSAPPPQPSPATRDAARALLRQWLADGEADVAASVAAIGARAVRAASAAVGRLDRLPPANAAERTLAHLEELARGFAEPEPDRTPFAFLRRQRADPDWRPQIQRLVEDLERESDELARASLTIDGDAKRLRAAATDLDDALLLLGACSAAVAAARREVALDRPDRAHFLDRSVAPRLVEREQDLLTQAAVTQQAILTLALLAEGQDVLARALTRARETSIAALRTAIAARDASEAHARLSSHADAIDPTGRGGAASPLDVRHALRHAIDEARRGAATGQNATTTP